MSGGLVVLISGRGSNLAAILDSPVAAQVSAVISDNPQAAGLQIARTHGKPAHVCAAVRDDALVAEPAAAYDGKPAARAGAARDAFEAALSAQINTYAPRLIALAGFMRVLSPEFIAAHGGRIVNIHPSLLPAFRGLHTHRRALAEGAREHGCTVHWVNGQVDDGAIIASDKLTVQPHEDEAALAARVLQLEHRLYPRVLGEILSNAA